MENDSLKCSFCCCCCFYNEACIWNQQVHYDGDHWQENGVDFYCTGHSSEKVRPGCYVETNRVKCTGVMPGMKI